MLQKVQIQRNALQKVSKVLRQSLVLLTFLFSFQSFSQHQVGISACFHRLGLFQGIEYEYMHKRWGFPFEMDYNLLRLIEQRKLQFRLVGGVNYAFVKQEKLRVKANLTYGIFDLAVTENQRHYWDEVLVGPSLEVGQKWKFVLRTKVGWMQQRFRSAIDNKWIRAGGFGFSLKMGLLYEI